MVCRAFARGMETGGRATQTLNDQAPRVKVSRLTLLVIAAVMLFVGGGGQGGDGDGVGAGGTSCISGS